MRIPHIPFFFIIYVPHQIFHIILLCYFLFSLFLTFFIYIFSLFLFYELFFIIFLISSQLIIFMINLLWIFTHVHDCYVFIIYYLGQIGKKKTYDLNTQVDPFFGRFAGSPFPEAVEANEKELAEVTFFSFLQLKNIFVYLCEYIYLSTSL